MENITDLESSLRRGVRRRFVCARLPFRRLRDAKLARAVISQLLGDRYEKRVWHGVYPPVIKLLRLHIRLRSRSLSNLSSDYTKHVPPHSESIHVALP